MELINPAEISGKIMTLIDNATETIIIISPYIKISKWTKLTNRIKEAQKRGVKFEWFIRKDSTESIEEVKNLGITPVEIENLHSKIYVNEKAAIVTSMNLHYYSDSNSIDIGYLTTKHNEYEEIVSYINTYIKPKNNSKVINKVQNPRADYNNSKSFIQALEEFLKKNQYLNRTIFTKTESNNKISIDRFKNDYSIIFEPRSNYFRIDLRINLAYEKRCHVYNMLLGMKDSLEERIGHSIDFGSQMKRLKIDIQNPVRHNPLDWKKIEFDQNVDLISRVIVVYYNILP